LLCVCITSTALLVNPAQAGHYVAHQATPAQGPAFAAIVVDANSGRALFASNENEPRHPASLTKVMTLYLLFEQLDKGRLSLSSPLSISARAASQAPSKLGLESGETISVENAIKAIVTRSANDVAVVVAEDIGGDEAGFAQMMTRKARDLGMSHTTYVNASGLPNDRQVTTARDLTVLGRAVQQRFPRYFHYFSTASFEYAGEVISNHNHLLGRVDGVDGIKTGYTNASGFNLLTSVHRGGHSLVAVVMGGLTAAARDRYMELLIAQHIASATTTHGAAMIAVASNPSAAIPRVLPIAIPTRSGDNDRMPTPPVRASVAALSQVNAEGDGVSDERDSPNAMAAPNRHSAKRNLRVRTTKTVSVSTPLVRSAESNPAGLGWIKGPESVTPIAKPM
jgi:D-alanyl-D-alanine carboxypeptidase